MSDNVEKLRAALYRVMIGGNHLATWRSDRWPDYDLDGLTREQQCENALRILGATPEYDMWVCWSLIMQVRDEVVGPLPPLPVPGLAHSADEDNETRSR